MTITVALGTSTPTSITVVETNTSISPFWNSRMVRSFFSASRRPCSRPTGRSGKILLLSSSNICMAAFNPLFPPVGAAPEPANSISGCSSAAPSMMGRQADVVYSVIEGAAEEQPEMEFAGSGAAPTGGKSGLKAAMQMFEELRSKILPDLHVGLLHGRLDAEVKDRTMRE